MSKYQQLRRAGLCTRNCGRKAALVNRHVAVAVDGKRHSECRTCATTTHGRANKK
jgi:hypothetical protein